VEFSPHDSEEIVWDGCPRTTRAFSTLNYSRTLAVIVCKGIV
jgi:hypothetical protein